eukprot:TRINITY_DN6918_c0_g1_i1.p1 TRINITY_DN6918_c0_g1~~TRINITY_DN6918_c0_g1_i1.p1  ORF type:complete len:176 (+),score=30.38 TRINITY_DN6918_c0_g1_i1:218-745(+)
MHSEQFYDTEGFKVTGSGKYNHLDPLLRHPETGAVMFVGSQSAASSKEVLMEHGITHVVNCTADMPLYFEGELAYLRFNITQHYSKVRDPNSAVRFVQPLFDFVGEALSNGHNVLVHCLAGAHRAGTSGILCLMQFGGLGLEDAIQQAKDSRRCINPIGGFPQLLRHYEKGRQEN